jgi:hypothetical protein
VGVLDIIDDVFNAIGTAGKIAITVFVILLIIFLVVIPIASMTWDKKDEIVEETERIAEEVEDVAETVKEVTPQVFEAAQTICELDETVLTQLRPNTIESYMLNNVGSLERTILENWRDTGEITACELKILDENIDDYYKERLNLKSVSKSIVGCNLVDCLEKYKVIENLDSQK